MGIMADVITAKIVEDERSRQDVAILAHDDLTVAVLSHRGWLLDRNGILVHGVAKASQFTIVTAYTGADELRHADNPDHGLKRTLWGKSAFRYAVRKADRPDKSDGDIDVVLASLLACEKA